MADKPKLETVAKEAGVSTATKAHPGTTAVVCNGDMVAPGASPPLTTMAVSPYQPGRRLARVMLDRVRDPEMPVTISEVPAELVIRETTGPPRRRAVAGFRVRRHI